MAVTVISNGSVAVKIYSARHRQGQIHEVRDHREGYGQTFRKQFRSLKEAKQYARAIADAIRSGTTEFVDLDGNTRRKALAFLDVCQKHDKEIEDTVWRLNAQWNEEGAASLSNGPLVADVVKEYLQIKQRQGLGAYHLRDLSAKLGKFAASFPTTIDEIQRPVIEEWLNGLPIHSPKTWNNYRNTVAALFIFAKEANYLPEDWDEMKAIKKAVIPEADPIIFSPQEGRQILEGASPESFRRLLAIGAFTGIRSEEIFKLAWEDFDWTHPPLESVPGIKLVGTIWLRRKIVKGRAEQKRQRQVLVPENLRAWLMNEGTDRIMALEELKRRTGPIHEYKNPKVVAGLKTKLAQRLGIIWKKNALRKSWISYSLALTKDAYKVSTWAGNSVDVVKETYERLVSEEAALQWFSIYPARHGRTL